MISFARLAIVYPRSRIGHLTKCAAELPKLTGLFQEGSAGTLLTMETAIFLILG